MKDRYYLHNRKKSRGGIVSMSETGAGFAERALSPSQPHDMRAPETYLVGKRDYNSYFVTVCRTGQTPERLEGFRSAELARAWVKKRVQALTLTRQ